MKHLERYAATFAAGILILAVFACPAVATETLMAELPSSTNFSCTNCHDGSGEPAATNLNVFGIDFQANFSTWDQSLASLDSDGDGCTNGVELGDSDGNGVLDNGIVQESSRPGVTGDCSAASTDESTWSNLKNLFNGSK